jgi:hypothetical protein
LLDGDRKLLALALETAIPLHAAQLRDAPERTRLRLARYAGEVLACHGDVLQFRSSPKGKKKGSESKTTAEVFTILARGLAAAQTLGHDIDFVLERLRG